MTEELINKLVKQCELVEYVAVDRQLVVKGYMNFEEEEDPKFEFHNCDAMGCGSAGPHILFKFEWGDGIAK